MVFFRTPIKPILKRVSRYADGSKGEVPPRSGDPFDEWETKLRFNLTPEQAAKSENFSYRQYYAEQKLRRQERKKLGLGIWGKLKEEEKQKKIKKDRERERKMRELLEDEDDSDEIDWEAMGIASFSPEEWERMEMEANGGKVKLPVEEKKEERVYTGITITERNPKVDDFMKNWMKLMKLEVKVEGACGSAVGQGMCGRGGDGRLMER